MFTLEIGYPDGRPIETIERAACPLPRKGEIVWAGQDRRRVLDVVHALDERRVTLYVRDLEVRPEEVDDVS